MVFFKGRSSPLSSADEKLLIESGDEAALMAAACTPPSPEAYPAVAVYFNDRNIQSQLDWIEGLFPDCFTGRISESYIAPIANRNFGIFVVCGNDPKRMVKLMRHYHNLIGRKLCIGMMLRSTPGDRVRLLNAGFDEVFDLRSNHIEATCRINAHLRRMENRADSAIQASGSERDDKATDALLRLPASERERLVLALMARHLNELTPTSDIHREIRRRYGRSHPRSLHVVISLLRKKLRADYAITFRSEGGYVLAPRDANEVPAHTPAHTPAYSPAHSGANDA